MNAPTSHYSRMEEIFIIRFSDAIRFPSGEMSNIWCCGGTRQEAEERATKIAQENGVTVAAIT